MTFRRDPNLIHWIKFDVTQHTDHLGSPVSGTDAVGNVAWRERYTPYGEKMLNPTALDNQAAFTGHIHDAKTGLTYMQARYYDPNIGRFLSIDPVNISDNGNPIYFNRYAYVGGDPVNMWDPHGEDGLTIKHEAQGNFIVAGEVSRQVGFAAEGGPKWLGGIDFGVVYSFGVGGGWPPDFAGEVGAGHFEGTFADLTRDAVDLNGNIDLVGGIAVDAAFDNETGEYSSGAISLQLGAPSPSGAVVLNQSIGFSLSGVHRGGETTPWSDIVGGVIGKDVDSSTSRATGGQFKMAPVENNSSFDRPNPEIRQQSGNGGAFHIWGK